MTCVCYDGTYEGFLTAVFEVYEYKLREPRIFIDGTASGSLFAAMHSVHTSAEKSGRVLARLKEKLSLTAQRQLYKTFLSEQSGIEDVLLRYIRYAMDNKLSIENNYAHPDVLQVQQMSRKVDREKHRMEAFVRFQLTRDQLYYAIIQPDYNVLPLIRKHFQERYADQRWLIYDGSRRYGLYYDLQTTQEVQMEFDASPADEATLKGSYNDHEEIYQQLWQQYFTSINIQARKNMKLHIRHMPRRYWRYLIEKKP